ncbi:ribosomal protection-like ABC-F family protein [Gallicola sp. Sow4_E12]|uniref:ribosomal protection-like ABC-F family protein n=1 Tax=Gallicola sp. Sow4_E12 TaxID=3438785 RepID=UPI003F90F2C5
MIYLDNLRKEFGTRTLFEIERLSVSDDDKIGLIGNNGVGKTTFLRILLGQDTDYNGSVDVQGKLDSLLNDGEEQKFSEEIYMKAELDDKNKYSPGEYQRLKLAKLLSNESAFLLVDEPTSHLDIKQKERLAESLKSRYKGYILISHDRDFINQTCDKIFELSNGKLEVFNGDYSFYLEEREKINKFAQREYEGYISEKKRLTNIAKDIQTQSSKVRTTPKRMGNSEARLHKMGGQGNKKKLDKQVKSIKSRIDQLEVKEKPKEVAKIELTIAEKDKLFSNILVRAENLNKRFGKKLIFDHANIEIHNNTKIALLGENGSGKTTLLNMILNKEVWVHPNIKIGYYSQLGEIINMNKSILDNVLESSIYDQTMTRIILARLGFKTDDVYKKLEILSDGERAKVKLAKLVTSDFNFLIMDEPTNFLDISAIEALEELLKGYDRPLLFVTHDVSFINNVADELLMIDNHKIKSFRGNLAQFKKSQERSKTNTTSDDFLLEFRLSSINNRLAQEISKEEREELEAEYKNLIQKMKR